MAPGSILVGLAKRNGGVMARKARIEFAGALYHVLVRWDRREGDFADEENCGATIAVAEPRVDGPPA